MLQQSSGTDRERAIFQIQEWLRGIERGGMPIPLIVPDGIYDGKTKNAVRVFQGLMGMGQTGIVDYATWLALRDAYEAALQKAAISNPIYPFECGLKDNKLILGDSLPLVSIIQIMLESLSTIYGDLEEQQINGIFDEPTSENIACLQGVWNLPQTGEVDSETWNRLADSFNKNQNRE